jgi:hypothetical protein
MRSNQYSNQYTEALLLGMILLTFTGQMALAKTFTLECSLVGFPDRAPFTVDIDEDSRTVTLHWLAENIVGYYQPPSDSGPWPATIGDKKISFHQQPVGGRGFYTDTVIDRVTGRMMMNVRINSSDTQEAHTASLCHVAKPII